MVDKAFNMVITVFDLPCRNRKPITLYPSKLAKLLITAGGSKSDAANQVQEVFAA